MVKSLAQSLKETSPCAKLFRSLLLVLKILPELLDDSVFYDYRKYF